VKYGGHNSQKFRIKEHASSYNDLPSGGTSIKKMATPEQKEKYVLWFNETKSVKRV
jgi:hypothetical protein